MSEKAYCVYIVTNKQKMLYTGVTNDLKSRASTNKVKSGKGFTKKIETEKLVYYETCGEIHSAISREKQISAVSSKKKIELIESMNPNWSDLFKTI